MAHREWRVHTGEDFGRAIAEIRRRRHLTQAQVAEQGGLSRSYLSKLEAGRSALVLEQVLRVLRRLGASVTITLQDDDGRA